MALVVTHRDHPDEALWFERVADVAASYGIATLLPDDPNTPTVVAAVAGHAPDFLFSFYYRSMLGPQLLALPRRGALNMHGSLLPRYRGRAPVNWAVLHGERETGASLHYMVDKPDAGDLVAQTAVPILPDDTAREVFTKVTVAAEMTLDRAMPGLLAGTAPRVALALHSGSYFGGRTAADGRIDWRASAATIHNLVRAVAPPYPGAATTLEGHPARILRSRIADVDAHAGPASIEIVDGRLIARCGGGGSLTILDLEVSGKPMSVEQFRARWGAVAVPLGGPNRTATA